MQAFCYTSIFPWTACIIIPIVGLQDQCRGPPALPGLQHKGELPLATSQDKQHTEIHTYSLP